MGTGIPGTRLPLGVGARLPLGAVGPLAAQKSGISGIIFSGCFSLL